MNHDEQLRSPVRETADGFLTDSAASHSRMESDRDWRIERRFCGTSSAFDRLRSEDELEQALASDHLQ